ncbi:hypothetical protein FW781_00760 (plasmid) [Chryseobacterium panacisoli]|uniref:Uncharacterized protein n=1 Tax=Chryseobacterium panacisoli TaxID=1807141 RepID=A0A5D8ZVD3_9FLAO|nr:hypothetical protein [Chryseobacterium panacisoli]TZF98490.1 hypothetical protein FW781_00760 [Chryseobacterium panacisoli]
MKPLNISPLQKAKNLMDSGQYISSLTILEALNGLSSKSEKYRLLFMSNCWFNLEEYDWAIEIADRLLQKDLKNELASQIKYLSYCKLKDYGNINDEVIISKIKELALQNDFKLK